MSKALAITGALALTLFTSSIAFGEAQRKG
jgi:hypothetical protein